MNMTRRGFGLAIFTVAAFSTGAAVSSGQPKGRPLAIEDYYKILSVGAPAISPDGRWVSVSVSTRVEENQGTRNEAFVVPADGSAGARKLTHDGKDVSASTWTTENRLRYTIDGQAWTIDPATPSATPVKTEGAQAGRGGRGGRGGGPPADGGGAAVASPDGAWTIAVRDKPPAPVKAPALSDFEKRHEDRFKGAQFDWKDFQRDGQPFPAPNTRARPGADLVLQPSGGGAPRVLLDQDLRPTNVVWHPNSTLVAFLADPEWRDELQYEDADLYTVTTDGRLTRLTNDLYVHSDVEFSPDGKYLSYARTFGTDLIIQKKLNHGGPRDLYVRPVAGGEPVNLTASWDLEPGDARWSPDSRFLYFAAGIGGESHWFRVSVPGGKVEQLTKGPRRIGGISIDRNFTRMAYTVGVHESPPDVYVANIDGSGERKLTDIHRAFLNEVALSPSERLRWPSDDGTQIEGWLTFPHGYNASRGPYPLIVFSHGGPHSATGYSFDFKKQFFAANGYFVFDTNFRSSTGYGDAFKWATWGEWGKKDGQDVMSGIDYVIKRYPIDARRVGHTGHSYGGFMTNWLITQYPDRLAAAITGAGITNWISDYGTADIYRTKETEFFGTPWDKDARDRMIKQSPLTYAGNVKTPTLFVHGEVDQRVPYTEGEQMYFALKRRGVPAKMIQYAGQPHGIGGHWNNVHRMLNELRWWEMHLKPNRRP
jgi:dipeptidyl aminopeptidase/acylaminoacyl peptidase